MRTAGRAETIFVGDVDWVRRNHITECMNLSTLNVTFSTLPKIDEAEQMDEACQLKFTDALEGEPTASTPSQRACSASSRVWLSSLR